MKSTKIDLKTNHNKNSKGKKKRKRKIKQNTMDYYYNP